MSKDQLMYRLEDRAGFWITAVAALQWLVFIMLNNIFVPIVIGSYFNLSVVETAALVQRTIFLVGLASLLQIWIGHRLPLVEGAAGLWWSVFILAAQSGAALGMAPREILPALSGGLVIAGTALILLGVTPLFHRLERLFTPMVTGCYMILLSIQMSAGLFTGMLGADEGQVDGRIFAVACMTVAATLLLSQKGKGLLKSFSPLGGIIGGWLLFYLLGLGGGEAGEGVQTAILSLPMPFAWGIPRFDTGIIVTALVTALILMANLFASIQVIKVLQPDAMTAATASRGGIVNGVADILAGVFSTIGTTPFSITVGFIQITGNAARHPFAWASFLMMAAGLINPVGGFFTTIPVVIAYAVGFTAFCQLMIYGIRSVSSTDDNERNGLTANIGLCVGVGIMFMPAAVFQPIPAFFRSILSNGMLVGTLLVLVLEHVSLPGSGKAREMVSKKRV